jgi:hypothetical protein
MAEKLNPILERGMAEAAERADESFKPPARKAWYELPSLARSGRYPATGRLPSRMFGHG